MYGLEIQAWPGWPTLRSQLQGRNASPPAVGIVVALSQPVTPTLVGVGGGWLLLDVFTVDFRIGSQLIRPRRKSISSIAPMGPPRLTFSTSSLPSSSPSTSHFNPRLGSLTLQRNDAAKSAIKIDTPGLLTTASRGLIPHLSLDHVNATAAIRWVNIPFETLWVMDD